MRYDIRVRSGSLTGPG